MIFSIKKSKYSDSLIILKQIEAGIAVRNMVVFQKKKKKKAG